eukprot:768183-Hanusia_phi.AAC.3
MGNANKILTLVVNGLLWDQHASLQVLFLRLLTLPLLSAFLPSSSPVDDQGAGQPLPGCVAHRSWALRGGSCNLCSLCRAYIPAGETEAGEHSPPAGDELGLTRAGVTMDVRWGRGRRRSSREITRRAPESTRTPSRCRRTPTGTAASDPLLAMKSPLTGSCSSWSVRLTPSMLILLLSSCSLWSGSDASPSSHVDLSKASRVVRLHLILPTRLFPAPARGRLAPPPAPAAPAIASRAPAHHQREAEEKFLVSRSRRQATVTCAVFLVLTVSFKSFALSLSRSSRPWEGRRGVSVKRKWGGVRSEAMQCDQRRDEASRDETRREERRGERSEVDQRESMVPRLEED